MTRKKANLTALALLSLLVLATAASLPAASPKHHHAAAVPPDAVLTWNANAVAAVRASAPTKSQTEGFIYMSYVQAAVYDAVTKIAGRYEPYHGFDVTVGAGASPQAAVAAATRTILDHYLPDQQTAVDAKYVAYLAALEGDVAEGAAVGEAAARDIIALRVDDGRLAATPAYGTVGPILPGQWQLQTVGQTAQTPWVATMRPFLLERASQFRADAPPSLGSRRYAEDLSETQAYGALTSTVRTAEQTATAYFWNANNINQYNQTMQNVTVQHQLDLVDAARLFAMGELVSTDAGIACFDSKYFYQYWRPITAIRNADSDGNDATTADAAWAPVLATPNHPEYPSQHGCFTSAFTETLAAALRTRHIDITVPGATNGGTTLTTTRHYESARDVQREIVDARVWLGFHYRRSVEQGVDLGGRVAEWTLDRYFKPVRP
jgi:hypothetical protein